MMAGRGNVIKLGLIGCGRVAETCHLPALQNLAGAEVVAVADLDPDRLRQVADRFHIKRRSTNFVALLDDPSIEAIAVCVPVQFHAEVALAALKAGKHLFIEKPLALTLEEADRLIACAGPLPRTILVGFNLRWHRLVRQAQRVIKRGVLGPLELMRTAFTSYHETIPEWRKRRALGGGVFFELAVHHFDLWRFLLQSEVEEVFAVSRSSHWEDETATVTARLTNGVFVTSVFSERTNESNEIEIYGQAGCLRVSCYRFDGLEYVSSASLSGDVRTRLRRMVHTLEELPQGAWRMLRGGDLSASYQAEWRHFINAIQHGGPVGCTLADGRQALEVAVAAVESAVLGRPVPVARRPRSAT
ncbi:MAG TPA: Gfo/Idh/MocA family oxidoreductase [Candidatus Binatia bacterium]|jgi:myo-inositol 2-dehydrogenase/D-chiro-inositol 1-dehydrogenase|nr:Gfo/Idh/MocA family oxidoreductase [Candidatus Binatia bacterium]